MRRAFVMFAFVLAGFQLTPVLAEPITRLIFENEMQWYNGSVEDVVDDGIPRSRLHLTGPPGSGTYVASTVVGCFVVNNFSPSPPGRISVAPRAAGCVNNPLPATPQIKLVSGLTVFQGPCGADSLCWVHDALIYVGGMWGGSILVERIDAVGTESAVVVMRPEEYDSIWVDVMADTRDGQPYTLRFTILSNTGAVIDQKSIQAVVVPQTRQYQLYDGATAQLPTQFGVNVFGRILPVTASCMRLPPTNKQQPAATQANVYSGFITNRPLDAVLGPSCAPGAFDHTIPLRQL